MVFARLPHARPGTCGRKSLARKPREWEWGFVSCRRESRGRNLLDRGLCALGVDGGLERGRGRGRWGSRTGDRDREGRRGLGWEMEYERAGKCWPWEEMIGVAHDEGVNIRGTTAMGCNALERYLTPDCQSRGGVCKMWEMDDRRRQVAPTTWIIHSRTGASRDNIPSSVNRFVPREIGGYTRMISLCC